MSSRWILGPLLVLSLSNSTYSQKLITGFTRELAFRPMAAPFSITTLDVNGDSTPDILVLSNSQLAAFDGRTFTTLFRKSVAPGTTNPSLADFNRDGFEDLIAYGGGSSIVVWYGPDFSNQRFFLVPGISNVFAVRNREDGQIEFTFGFSDQSTQCQPVPAICTKTTTGHLIRYADTTFAVSDRVSLGFNPSVLFWQQVAPAQQNFFSAGYFSSCTYPTYAPTICEDVSWGLWIGGREAFSGSYYWKDLCSLNGMILQDYKNGNLDADSAREAVEFIYAIGCCSPCTFPPYFRVRDLLSGAVQWSRSDISWLRFISTVDLNGDGIDELLAYKIQGDQPVLYEFRASDGATLGFTPLPFRADTMIAGFFGQPAKPKLLLAQADSIVVFGIDVPCAVAKGDMNADGNLTLADVTLEINCAFLEEGNCNLCFADVNCDGTLAASDVVWELIAVFLQKPLPCT